MENSNNFRVFRGCGICITRNRESVKVISVIYWINLIENSIKLDASNRIVGGVTAYPGEFPNMCSLQQRRTILGNTHICGASLITEQWLLSAAHCGDTVPARQMIVVCGIRSLTRPEAESGRQDRSVQLFLTHPYYFPFVTETFMFDISMVNNGSHHCIKHINI